MFNKSRNKLPNFSKIFKKVGLFGGLLAWLVYLVSANYAAPQSFEFDNLSTNLKSVEQEILLLNVKSSELQSIERIENDSKNLSLVQTKDVYYLSDTKEVVALR